MAQITWRTDDELVARVRLNADLHGVSMNEFLTQVMRTVTDPTYSASPSEQVRERLRMAGLLAGPAADPDDRPVSREEFDAARQAAAGGTPLSDIVLDQR